MTVANVIHILRDVKKVKLAWNGNSSILDVHDPITMDAFGDYLVAGVYSTAEDEFEIELAVRPIKKGAPV